VGPGIYTNEINDDDDTKPCETEPLDALKYLVKTHRVDKIRKEPDSEDGQDNTGNFKPAYVF